MKTYKLKYAYIGNTKIVMYNEQGEEEGYSIQSDENVQGYVNCLRDFGYKEVFW